MIVDKFLRRYGVTFGLVLSIILGVITCSSAQTNVLTAIDNAFDAGMVLEEDFTKTGAVEIGYTTSGRVRLSTIVGTNFEGDVLRLGGRLGAVLFDSDPITVISNFRVVVDELDASYRASIGLAHLFDLGTQSCFSFVEDINVVAPSLELVYLRYDRNVLSRGENGARASSYPLYRGVNDDILLEGGIDVKIESLLMGARVNSKGWVRFNINYLIRN